MGRARPVLDNVGKRVFVENRKESAERLVKHALEPAGRRDGAGATSSLHAFGEREFLLCCPYQGADCDFFRHLGEANPAGAPARRLHEAEISQRLGHLEQVIARKVKLRQLR